MHYFSFDFSGSGNSDGEYISLGVHETEDLESIVKYIREKLLINQIVLWGRSMGAVTALRYAEKDKKINGIISDSPFSSLYKLALELGEEKTSIPGILLPPMLKLVEQTIKDKAGFDFKALEMCNFSQNSTIPCIFITSKEDSFVRAQHVETLYKHYAGKKKLLYVNGDHNNERTREFLTDISKNIIDFFTQKKIPTINEVKIRHKSNAYQDKNINVKNSVDEMKIFNLQSILESNKEIAKKLVLNKKIDSYTRLDTEVLYEDIPEMSNNKNPYSNMNNGDNINNNINKTPISSAFRLKDKMQSLIHNASMQEPYDKNNINSNNENKINTQYSYGLGSIKHSNDTKRILNDFYPKSSAYSNNISNSPYKNDSNYSFHFTNNELDIKKDYISDFQPQIQINNICYSNPVDLKKENNNKVKNKKIFINQTSQYDSVKSESNEIYHNSFTHKNRQFL